MADSNSRFLSPFPTSQVHTLLNGARQIMNHFFYNIESDTKKRKTNFILLNKNYFLLRKSKVPNLLIGRLNIGWSSRPRASIFFPLIIIHKTSAFYGSTEVFEERKHNKQFERIYLVVILILFFLYLVFSCFMALNWCKSQEVQPSCVFRLHFVVWTFCLR